MHDFWHYWPKKNYQCDSNFFADNFLYEILASVLFKYFVDIFALLKLIYVQYRRNTNYMAFSVF